MSWLKQLSNQWQKNKLQRAQLAPMFEPPIKDQWVAIDCEMTGLNPRKHHLLSVAAIHINGENGKNGETVKHVKFFAIFPIHTNGENGETVKTSNFSPFISMAKIENFR